MRKRGKTLFQVFKYAVYLLLAINVYVFFAEEHLAARLQFPDGIGLAELIEAYAATIDTAAWLFLLLLFELETYILDDRHFTRRVTLSLHTARALLYAIIVYAFYGYVVNVAFVYGVSPLDGVANPCALVDLGWSYAIDLDEYVALDASNCATFTSAESLYRFDTMPATVDLRGLVDIQRLAWVDAINAAVWLLVVLLLEIDVRLQESNRYEGTALALSTGAKVILYSLLFLAAVYWGFKGDFVDFWDAFLWLVAFVFIEMNIFEWHREAQEDQFVAGEDAAT